MARQDDRGTILWTDKKRTFLGLPLSFTRYYLTDHQLITRVGFLSIKEDEIELYRIVDKRIEQTGYFHSCLFFNVRVHINELSA